MGRAWIQERIGIWGIVLSKSQQHMIIIYYKLYDYVHIPLWLYQSQNSENYQLREIPFGFGSPLGKQLAISTLAIVQSNCGPIWLAYLSYKRCNMNNLGNNNNNHRLHTTVKISDKYGKSWFTEYKLSKLGKRYFKFESENDLIAR